VSNILAKLVLRNRTEAAAYAATTLSPAPGSRSGPRTTSFHG
jgi:hypothetical protein